MAQGHILLELADRKPVSDKCDSFAALCQKSLQLVENLQALARFYILTAK